MAEIKLGNIKGPKGDAFKYSDFTPTQLAGLKGDKGDKGEDSVSFTSGSNSRGSWVKYSDGRLEQVSKAGVPLTYEVGKFGGLYQTISHRLDYPLPFISPASDFISIEIGAGSPSIVIHQYPGTTTKSASFRIGSESNFGSAMTVLILSKGYWK